MATRKGRGFLVAHRRCDQCLFGPNKIVSDARRDQILEELDTLGDERHFVCHKIAGRDAQCRADYDRDPERTQGQRIAARLGVLQFVDEDGYVVEEDAHD